MSISSIAAQTNLNALYASQATSAPTSGSMALPDDSDDDTAADGSLTGSTTASLDSQTLQALLNLTQGSDPSQGAQGQQAPQGAHHRHHHHGGGQPPQQSGATAASSTTTGTTADSSVADSDVADEVQDSLASALTAAA